MFSSFQRRHYLAGVLIVTRQDRHRIYVGVCQNLVRAVCTISEAEPISRRPGRQS